MAVTEELKAYKAKWYQDNKKRILASRKAEYAADPEHRLDKIAYARQYEKDHPEKKKEYISSPEWAPLHKAYHKEYDKTWSNMRYRTDPSYRAKKLMRSAMYRLMKARGIIKTKHTLELLGCADWDAFKTYLESTFLEGMSWDCFGRIEVDHIRACCSFDLSDPEQQKICWHYTNLRCLWKEDNRAKLIEDKKSSLKLLAKRAAKVPSLVRKVA